MFSILTDAMMIVKCDPQSPSDITLMRTHILDIPWEMRTYAPTLGAKRDKQKNAWVYVGNDMPAELSPYASQDHSLERWIEDDANGSMKPTTKAQIIFKARPHQMVAAKKIAAARKKGFRGFLESDDVGLGKTLSCIIGAYGVAKIDGFTPAKKAKLLIVCPNSAIAHWRDTIAASGVDQLFRIVVINYERLHKLLDAPESAKTAKTTRTKNKRVASGGTPKISWDVIIADESHKLKNGIKVQQAKAFERIARYALAAKNAPFVIWASATAAQNPVEAVYLAPLIAQMTGSKKTTMNTWGEYLIENGYAVKPAKVGVTWINLRSDATPAERKKVNEARHQDLMKLRALLFSPTAPSIRRLPQNIAGWPSIQRIPQPSDLSLKERVLYEQAWVEFRSALTLDRASKNPKGALAIQTRFRQKISLIKIPHTIQNILDLLDNGQQVVVSTEFSESLDIMRSTLETKGIASSEISGRLDKQEKETQRINFQKGQTKVIFCTVVDAISLHAGQSLADGTKATSTPRATLVHDVRYSGIANIQLGGRAHRDGQNANVFYGYFRNTVEDKIVHTVIDRISAVHKLSGDPESITNEIDNLLVEESLK
jgi:SNF2-related domain